MTRPSSDAKAFTDDDAFRLMPLTTQRWSNRVIKLRLFALEENDGGCGHYKPGVFLSRQFSELFLTGAEEIYRSDRAGIFDVEGNKIERRARLSGTPVVVRRGARRP